MLFDLRFVCAAKIIFRRKKINQQLMFGNLIIKIMLVFAFLSARSPD
jgi:hypothetical protein